MMKKRLESKPNMKKKKKQKQQKKVIKEQAMSV